MKDQVTGTMTIYLPESYYPDTVSIRSCPIILMPSARLGGEKYQLYESLPVMLATCIIGYSNSAIPTSHTVSLPINKSVYYLESLRSPSDFDVNIVASSAVCLKFLNSALLRHLEEIFWSLHKMRLGYLDPRHRRMTTLILCNSADIVFDPPYNR